MRNDAPITKIDAALTIVWPDDLRTVLLRACLWTGVKAEKSWREFVSETGDSKVFFERDSSGLKGLLPLVHAAARRNSFELDEQSWTYLRAAAVREELRYGVYRQICGRVLRACVDADISVIALKACALADTVYSTPAERHCHAIDLLVSRNSLAGIERLVRPLGFRPARVAEARLGGRRGFRHESGLPLIFH